MLPAYLLSVSMVILSSPGLNPLPGVETKGLDPSEISALVGLLGQGACPCDPKLSILQCIQGQNCEKASQLAVYGAGKFREGLSTTQVSQAVIQKYIEDYVRYQFDTVNSPMKGAKTPSITIVEFADFECPHCSAMRAVLGEVIKKYPKDVALVFKQFPLPHHVHAQLASQAALAAHKQGRFWEMHNLIFDNQTNLTTEKFSEFARSMGLDMGKFTADMHDNGVKAQIDKDRKEAMEAQISGTPAIYINGRIFTDEKTPEKISAFVENLLKKKK
jgi:protein-disulfide isomerase